MTKSYADSLIRLTASRRCTLCGIRFAAGDMIDVVVGETFDDADLPRGPWGDPGIDARAVRQIADVIIDVRDGSQIYPYATVTLDIDATVDLKEPQ